MNAPARSISAKRLQRLAQLLNYAVLLAGALVFALPFVNMVATSVKLDEEMGADNFHILPSAPIARHASPYAMEDTGHTLQRPGDMPFVTWTALRPRLEQSVSAAIGNWWDRQQQLPEVFASVDRAAAIHALLPVVGTTVLEQISDTSRAAGIDAMAAEATRLATDQLIADSFEEYIPRFCLGAVRVRLSDYSTIPAADAPDWRAVTSNATLLDLQPPLAPAGSSVRMMQWSAARGQTVSARVQTPLSADTASRIDRVYLSYRPDQSWAKIEVDISCAGRKYQLDDTQYADQRKWNELQLRLPGREPEPISGRDYLHLRDVGPASATDPPFAVTLRLLPTGTPGAWWAKATRNYASAFRQAPIGRYIATSVALAILSILLTVFGSSLSAYAFARIDFPGRNLLFGLLLATMMIPGQVTMIPAFLISKSLGWYNTLYPLWIPAAFGSAFFIFMMREFLLAVPRELEESARIDGCGFLRIYWHIMLPLIRPTLITVAIFAFMGSWNNFMGPLIYVNDERLYNLAFGLFKFQLQSGTDNSLMMAGSFVMTLPIIALFFLCQRYFIRGISLTGLGGR